MDQKLVRKNRRPTPEGKGPKYKYLLLIIPGFAALFLFISAIAALGGAALPVIGLVVGGGILLLLSIYISGLDSFQNLGGRFLVALLVIIGLGLMVYGVGVLLGALGVLAGVGITISVSASAGPFALLTTALSATIGAIGLPLWVVISIAAVAVVLTAFVTAVFRTRKFMMEKLDDNVFESEMLDSVQSSGMSPNVKSTTIASRIDAQLDKLDKLDKSSEDAVDKATSIEGELKTIREALDTISRELDSAHIRTQNDYISQGTEQSESRNKLARARSKLQNIKEKIKVISQDKNASQNDDSQKHVDKDNDPASLGDGP